MNLVALYGLLSIIIAAIATKRIESKHNHGNTMSNTLRPLKQVVQCKCGKVKLAVDSPSTMRFVCYSKDYRGYYMTLNEQAKANNREPHAALDPWGGVDLTQLYPSEITVQSGADKLTPTLIREKSPVRRVYASCCDTPMFDIGGVSCLLNTDLVDEPNRPDVRFRIIGRHAYKTPTVETKEPRPSISWSVPLAWFWTMPGRIQKEKMEPTPIDITSPAILKNFKEG